MAPRTGAEGTGKPGFFPGVLEYYSDKIRQFGPTPEGVGWNGPDSQNVRFAQLAKVIAAEGGFSVAELGCGYGALYGFLSDRYDCFSYAGYDISAEAIRQAQKLYSGRGNARFIQSGELDVGADYALLSGMFNERVDVPDGDWLEYMERTLDMLDGASARGFAFNCLTKYSDADKMRDDLYYADPCYFFDLCKRRYSRNVALLHDYGLYDFTILVRKDL